jgi:hypothetical protein
LMGISNVHTPGQYHDHELSNWKVGAMASHLTKDPRLQRASEAKFKFPCALGSAAHGLPEGLY